jgi:pimeloyl-ACP methyl ester carboxylesterase
MGGYIAQLLAIKCPDIVSKLVLISSTADQRPYMAATMGQNAGSFQLPRPERKLLDYIADTAANPPQTADQIEENLIQGWTITYGGDRPFPRDKLTEALRRAAQRAPDGSTPFHHAFAVAASPDRLEAVGHIRAPTLIIHGRYDALLPLTHGEYLAQHIPGAQLRVFEMGHSFMWSCSNEVLDAVSKFLGD